MNRSLRGALLFALFTLILFFQLSVVVYIIPRLICNVCCCRTVSTPTA